MGGQCRRASPASGLLVLWSPAWPACFSASELGHTAPTQKDSLERKCQTRVLTSFTGQSGHRREGRRGAFEDVHPLIGPLSPPLDAWALLPPHSPSPFPLLKFLPLTPHLAPTQVITPISSSSVFLPRISTVAEGKSRPRGGSRRRSPDTPVQPPARASVPRHLLDEQL